MDKKELQKAIGERIREIRLDKGMSQQELASACDFEKSNMARIEAGRTNITIWTLYRLSNALEEPLKGFFEKFNKLAQK